MGMITIGLWKAIQVKQSPVAMNTSAAYVNQNFVMKCFLTCSETLRSKANPTFVMSLKHCLIIELQMLRK